MDTAQMAKQMIALQRTAFDNSYAAMSTAQDQTEVMINGYVEQFPWVTDEGKKQMKEVFSVAKKARDDFKKAVDQGYAKLEELLNQK
ncbi:MAG: hypothetical protein MJE63_33890 [Proteobacteria bacterium]|nr:hypothetical protein [Pseudomonadota bacterium]